MASKTRDKLIEVAKQLFLRNGVENTTISDIATASDKGRRTIYTYFKNKREIYKAVIERESDLSVSELRAIAESDAPAQERLRQFFTKRLSDTRTAVSPYSTIRSLLSSDYRRTERIRRLAYVKEGQLLREIMDDGVREGVFNRGRCDLLLRFLGQLVEAVDMAMINGDSPDIDSTFISSITEFLTLGVSEHR